MRWFSGSVMRPEGVKDTGIVAWHEAAPRVTWKQALSVLPQLIWAAQWLQSDWRAGSVRVYGMDMLDKGRVHVLGGKEWDDTRFHHATQKGMPFKIYELFISGIFCLIFSDHGWQRSLKRQRLNPWIRERLVYPHSIATIATANFTAYSLPPSKKPLRPLAGFPLPTPPTFQSPWQPLIWLLCLWIYLFWTLHTNRIIYMWPFETRFFHLTLCFQGLSMSSYGPVLHSF